MDKILYINDFLNNILGYALEVAIFFIVGFTLLKLWVWVWSGKDKPD